MIAKILVSFLLLSTYTVFADKLSTFYQCHGYKSIAIEKSPTGHDVIAVKLNGVNSKFIVDTGAKKTVIDDRLLLKYNIDFDAVISTEKGIGAAGEVTVNNYDIENLSISDHNTEQYTVGAINLSQLINGIGFTTGIWIDGIIGQDVLLSHSGIIDNPNNKLLLKSNALASGSCRDDFQHILENKGYQAIELNLLSFDLASFTLSMNNQSGDFILDSGAGSSIVTQSSLAQFHLDHNTIKNSQQSSGAGGAITLKTLPLGSVQIDDISYPLTTINTLDLSVVVSGVKTHSNVDIHGVIGQDLLQKYSSIISFHDKTLYLKPN